jgi:hypothetical protein
LESSQDPIQHRHIPLLMLPGRYEMERQYTITACFR